MLTYCPHHIPRRLVNITVKTDDMTEQDESGDSMVFFMRVLDSIPSEYFSLIYKEEQVVMHAHHTV